MSYTLTVTVVDDEASLPIPDVRTWLTSDLAGTSLLYQEYSDTSGVATYTGLASATYYLWGLKAGQHFTNPTTITIALANATQTLTGTAITLFQGGDTEICNLALGIVMGAAGASEPLLDTLEGTPSDTTSKTTMAWAQLYYPKSLAFVQNLLEWPECLRYDDPGAALDSTSANTNPGWEYSYSKPTGCLSFKGVVERDSLDLSRGIERFYPYAEIGDQIACDYEDTAIYFKYILLVTDTTKWSTEMTFLVAHHLSMYLARPMGLDAAGRDDLVKLYQLALRDARRAIGSRAHVSDQKLPVHRGRSFRGDSGYWWNGNYMRGYGS
jgi:hypothetical protein